MNTSRRKAPLKRQCMMSATTVLLVAMVSIGLAATNLNSSRSNIYRLTYDTSAVSAAQASALLVELDKVGRADEATLKHWLPANFKKLGIRSDEIQKVIVRGWDPKRKSITIILLRNPADEAAALAVSDEGAPADKSKKADKSAK